MQTIDLSPFIRAHMTAFVLAVIILYVVLDTIVAITPKRYQTEKWYGIALVFFRFIAAHVHVDEFGTAKIPFTNIVLSLGARPAVPAPIIPAVLDAEVTAKVPPSDAS